MAFKAPKGQNKPNGLKPEDKGKAEEKVAKHVRFSEHALTACGILSGITFTALVLIMQEKNAFALSYDVWVIQDYYVQILIGGMAGVSAAFILCTIGLVRPAAGLGLYSDNPVVKKYDPTEYDLRVERYINTTVSLYGIGCYGLLGMLPLLVLPFSSPAALIIIILEVLTIGILTYLEKKPVHT